MVDSVSTAISFELTTLQVMILLRSLLCHKMTKIAKKTPKNSYNILIRFLKVYLHITVSMADSVLTAFSSELMTLQVMILLRSFSDTRTDTLAWVTQPPRGLGVVRLCKLAYVTLSTTHCIVAGGLELDVVHSKLSTSPDLASRGPFNSTEDGATERKNEKH